MSLEGGVTEGLRPTRREIPGGTPREGSTGVREELCPPARAVAAPGPGEKRGSLLTAGDLACSEWGRYVAGSVPELFFRVGDTRQHPGVPWVPALHPGHSWCPLSPHVPGESRL